MFAMSRCAESNVPPLNDRFCTISLLSKAFTVLMSTWLTHESIIIMRFRILSAALSNRGTKR